MVPPGLSSPLSTALRSSTSSSTTLTLARECFWRFNLPGHLPAILHPCGLRHMRRMVKGAKAKEKGYETCTYAPTPFPHASLPIDFPPSFIPDFSFYVHAAAKEKTHTHTYINNNNGNNENNTTGTCATQPATSWRETWLRRARPSWQDSSVLARSARPSWARPSTPSPPCTTSRTR